MALSLRGWGAAEFRWASPEFLAAARWAVFVERIMPAYHQSQRTLAEPMPSDPEGKRTVASDKIAAQAFLADWTPVLFPADD